MIYVFENFGELASIVFDESTLTEQEKSQGIAVESLPVDESPAGMFSILKCKKSTKEVWYEYVEMPENEEKNKTEIEALKIDNEMLKLMVADLGLMVGGDL